MLLKLYRWLWTFLSERNWRDSGNLIKKLNIKKDKPDDRDFIYDKYPVALPSESYIIPLDHSYIKNQGSIGSCGSHAFGTAFEIMTSKFRRVHLSELFHYYVVRKRFMDVNIDRGQFLRDGAKVMQENGIALERFWPYIATKFKDEPTFKAYISARAFRIKSYYRIWNWQSIKSRIAKDEKPVVIGIPVWSSFMSNRNGIIHMPKEGERKRGGHAITVIGYDDNKKAFRIINSWGLNWGDNGYAWLPYDYVQKYLMDAWTMELY